MTEKRRFTWIVALDLMRAELNTRRGEWRELAARAGVSYRFLRYFAAGTHPAVSIYRVLSVAHAMGTPLQAVFTHRLPSPMTHGGAALHSRGRASAPGSTLSAPER